MSSVASLEMRIGELVLHRDKLEAEVVRLAAELAGANMANRELLQSLELQKAATAAVESALADVQADYIAMRQAMERVVKAETLWNAHFIARDALGMQRASPCPHDTKHAEWVCDDCGVNCGRVDHKSELTGRPRKYP